MILFQGLDVLSAEPVEVETTFIKDGKSVVINVTDESIEVKYGDKLLTIDFTEMEKMNGSE